MEKTDELKMGKKMCISCNKLQDSVKNRVVKENGVLGYYDIKVYWCDDCTKRHNYYLMAEWGQG